MHAPRRQAGEWLIFVLAVLLGTYGLGQATARLFDPAQGSGNPLWLALTGIALLVLIAQMGRVHDAWPRRHNRGTDVGANRDTVEV